MKLFNIIQKNFRIFFRSKISALIIFLGPLLLVSLIGMSFSNTQLPGLTVGTYSPSYNDFTDSIISKIGDSKFTIKKFDTNVACSDAVKRGDVGVCLAFPDNMDKNNNEVSFIVDYSKINLVWVVLDVISNRVSERASELRQNYATDLLTKVIQTKEDLNKQKADVDSLKTKQVDASDTTRSAKSALDGISTNTNFGDVSVTDAKTSLSQVTQKIQDAKDYVTTAKTTIVGSALPDDQKASINGKLLDALSRIDSALALMKGNSSVHSLEYFITQIDAGLQSAKLQLESIRVKKENVAGNLITLEDSLTQSINSISSVNNAMKDIVTRLEGIQSSDAQQLISPIRTKIEPVSSLDTHFNYLFPALIVLIIMITAILLSSTLVMDEKKSRSMFRNFITPTSDFVFNLGTFLTSFFTILIQLVIFLTIATFFFSTNITSSFWSNTLVLVLITSTFILLGMIIGYLFKSEETYVLAGVTVSALLLFLSSTILPIESISNSIRSFAAYTPFVVSENVLRQLMFFNFDLLTVMSEVLILVAYIAVFVGILFAVRKLARMHIFLTKKKDIKK